MLYQSNKQYEEYHMNFNKLTLLSLSLLSTLSHAMEEKNTTESSYNKVLEGSGEYTIIPRKTLSNHNFYSDMTDKTLCFAFHVLKTGWIPEHAEDDLTLPEDATKPKKKLLSIDDAQHFVVKRINAYYKRKYDKIDRSKINRVISNSLLIIDNKKVNNNTINKNNNDQNIPTKLSACANMFTNRTENYLDHHLSSQWPRKHVIEVGNQLITCVQLAVAGETATFSKDEVDSVYNKNADLLKNKEKLENQIAQQQALIDAARKKYNRHGTAVLLTAGAASGAVYFGIKKGYITINTEKIAEDSPEWLANIINKK